MPVSKGFLSQLLSRRSHWSLVSTQALTQTPRHYHVTDSFISLAEISMRSRVFRSPDAERVSFRLWPQ